MLAGLGATAIVLMVLGPSLGRDLLARLTTMLTNPKQGDVASALAAASWTIAAIAGPLVGAAVLATVLTYVLQTGPQLNIGALRPDFARLSPARGLKRLFGPTGLVETGKSVAKLSILGLAAYKVFTASLPDIAAALYWLPSAAAAKFFAILIKLTLTILGAQVGIAAFDFVWVRRRHARDLRMSKEEIRQEAKETDGNPQIKQRLRQIRMARSRKRMLAAVPQATVIVTNPTHYAIALAYDRKTGGAPRIVAKGADEVAARIREVAQASRIPLVSNPPLARALYACELDAEIPVEHFKLVAEIIAYVWRLGTRRPGA